MKKIALYSTLLFSFMSLHTAEAAITGIYIGGGAGYGILRTPQQSMFAVSGPGSSTSVKRGGLSGRVFVGYNATRYIGIEGGAAYYARSHYSANSGGLSSSLDYYGYSADGVIKVYLPFGCPGLNIYGLAGGVGFLNQAKFSNGGIPTTSGYVLPLPGTSRSKKARAIYGAGVSYDWGCRFTVNAEFTQVQAQGTYGHQTVPTPFANLYTINLAYHLS